MKKTLCIILCAILVNFISIMNVNAQENPLNQIIGTNRQFSGNDLIIIQEKIAELEKNLNLSEEQKKKAELIGKKAEKRLNVYNVNLVEEKKKLLALKESGANDTQIQAQIKVLKSIKSRLILKRKQNMQEFESILTTEQLPYFSQFKDDLKKIKE